MMRDERNKRQYIIVVSYCSRKQFSSTLFVVKKSDTERVLYFFFFKIMILILKDCPEPNVDFYRAQYFIIRKDSK